MAKTRRHTAEDTQKRATRKRRRHRLLTLAVFLLTAAIVGASAFWIWAFRFNLVASNSMAPTLEGSFYSRDRVLCWMLNYRIHPPRRWEVTVFHTPPNATSQEALPGMLTPGESDGLTVKRMVGLPGERLAIAGGDIWTRPLSGGRFVRRVKPDSVQRALWIGVYHEDFRDVQPAELLRFWNCDRPEALAVAPGFLRLNGGGADSGGVRLDYHPWTRIMHGGRTLRDLPGIPDRYVLDQEVTFLCPTPDCGSVFKARVVDQKVAARCPVCRVMAFEESVIAYGFRSGMPEIGPYSTSGIPQSDTTHNRINSYFMVPDLRLAMEVRPRNSVTTLRLVLWNDAGVEEVAFANAGISLNGRKLPGGGLPRDEWTRVEFYRVDGMVRVFVDGRQVSQQAARGAGEKPEFQWQNEGTGVAIAVDGGGEADVRELRIDRDVYYFSGESQGILNFLTGMEPGAEVDIAADAFFPLGDNTTVSLDGRSWGPIPTSLLMGRGTYIWSPPERRRRLPPGVEE